MIYKKLKKFGKEKDWYRTNSSVFGFYNQYLFNIYQGNLMSSPQFKTIQCRTADMTETQATELKTLFDQNTKSFKFGDTAVGKDFVSITFFENFSYTKAAKLQQTLDFVSNALSERQISSKYPMDKGLLPYNLSGEGVLLTQQEFINQNSVIEQAETQDKLERHSYLNGFLGSLLYSSAIIVLWVLCAVYLEVLSTGFSFIIAFAGIFGYDKFKGKLGFWTKWLLILSNIIIIYLANVASMAFELWRYDVPFNQMLEVMNMDIGLQKGFNTNLFISMMLGVLGWLWIVFDFKTQTEYIREAEKL